MREKLSGRDFTIRRLRHGDEEKFFEAVTSSADEVYPWLPWCHPGYELAEASEWINRSYMTWETGEEYNFLIIENSTGIIIGGCGLNRLDKENRMANLGYWVRSGYTCRGAASSAAHLLLEFGFTDLELNRIEIIAACDNIPSQKVAEKAGACREGILRSRILLHGHLHDAVLFSMLLPDWRLIESRKVQDNVSFG
ncbi:MAG: GNAT family N-acetyltransferase [Syntrophothermus sp.]